MRLLIVFTLIVLSGCASRGNQLSDKPPSLRVGAAALAGGAPEAALSIARRQLAQDRDNLPALLMEGQALTEMGELGQAEASFRRATHVAPGSTGAQFGLARVLLLNGKAPQAEALLKVMLASAPDDSRALTNLGIACDLQDNHAEAQKAYTAALRVSPELEAARVNLGLSMALAGDTTGSIAVLRPLAAEPNAPRRVRHDLATALALSGDQDGARHLLQADLSAEQMPIALAGYQALRLQ